ncbi:MAG: hypothetical protein ACR2PQ_13060 [Myxococcota bacterium]
MSAPLEVSSSRPPFWEEARREEPTWPAGRLDVRFDSEEALHRAVALLDGQTWVEDCRIDLGERTLHLRLATDAAPGFALATPGATDLH